MILLSHPTGNEFVRHALMAFDRAGMLGEFWTTVSWNPNSLTNRALPTRLREILERRSFPESISSRTHVVPSREMVRLFGGAIGGLRIALAAWGIAGRTFALICAGLLIVCLF